MPGHGVMVNGSEVVVNRAAVATTNTAAGRGTEAAAAIIRVITGIATLTIVVPVVVLLLSVGAYCVVIIVHPVI